MEHAGEATIVDAKQININGVRGTFFISSNAMEINEHGTFLLLKPSRFRQVAKLLTSRCTPAMKKSIAEQSREFWTKQTGMGYKFLSRLRKIKSDALRLKYKVKGNRFMSRKKRDRAMQKVSELIDVTLPTVGDRPGVSMQMWIHGRGALSIKLDGAAINHITYMVNEFFQTHEPDANTSGESGIDESQQEDADTEDDEVEIDGAGVDDDDDDEVDVENASIDEHAHISPENSSNDHAPAEDGASNTPTKKQSHVTSPIFAALVRGSKSSSA